MPIHVPAHAPKVLESHYGDKTLASTNVPVKNTRDWRLGSSNWAHPYRHHGTYR